MHKVIKPIVLSAAYLLIASQAFSMSISNKDAEARKLQITENGVKSEQDIGAGETVQLCAKGCFITFPDGTLTAYGGDEKIVIQNGGPALAN